MQKLKEEKRIYLSPPSASCGQSENLHCFQLTQPEPTRTIPATATFDGTSKGMVNFPKVTFEALLEFGDRRLRTVVGQQTTDLNWGSISLPWKCWAHIGKTSEIKYDVHSFCFVKLIWSLGIHVLGAYDIQQCRNWNKRGQSSPPPSTNCGRSQHHTYSTQ